MLIKFESYCILTLSCFMFLHLFVLGDMASAAVRHVGVWNESMPSHSLSWWWLCSSVFSFTWGASLITRVDTLAESCWMTMMLVVLPCCMHSESCKITNALVLLLSTAVHPLTTSIWQHLKLWWLSRGLEGILSELFYILPTCYLFNGHS